MKQIILTVLALVIVSGSALVASAQTPPLPRPPTREEIDPFPCRFEPCRPGQRPGDPWPDDGRYPDENPGPRCAVEVVEEHAKAADRAFAALIATPEFTNAKKFKSRIAKISSYSDLGKKSEKYFDLVGIDCDDPDEVVEFFEARSVKSEWLRSLAKHSELSAQQAEIVAAKLQIALRDNLQ